MVLCNSSQFAKQIVTICIGLTALVATFDWVLGLGIKYHSAGSVIQ